MQMRGEIAQLSCTPDALQLLVVTTLGDLHLLNLDTQVEELPGASLASLLSQSKSHCQGQLTVLANTLAAFLSGCK